MTGREQQLINEVIESNYLNDGQVTSRFEAAIAERLGVDYVVAVTSGTAALFLALAAVDVGPGNEVVVPDLTFVATANAVRLTGATPVLVDIDPVTLGLDPDAFAAAITPRTRAVMPVHVSGRSAPMDEITSIAVSRGIAVVEDAAEAFTSMSGGRYLGTIGDAGCLSFSPHKTVTTGQGGAVLTNDPAIHRRLRQLKDQGRDAPGTGGDDIHVSVGFNFKLTNLQAAVGLAQLGSLEERLARQCRTYELYAEALADLAQVRLPGFRIAEGEQPQWTDALVERRDELDAYLRARDMHCRRFWHPVHRQAPYRRPDDAFPNTVRISESALWLPSAFTLSDADVTRVAEAVRAFYTAC